MHVMIDLETMGTSTDAPIVAIGAVLVDPTAEEPIADKFYVAVDLASSVESGAKIDADTVIWWMRQSNEARGAITTTDAVDISGALSMFARWLENSMKEFEGEIVEGVWGNGVDFDNAILGAAYRRRGFAVPWKFWNNRCYRTLKNLFLHIPADTYGTAHNALDDAIKQGRHLAKILRTIATYQQG